MGTSENFTYRENLAIRLAVAVSETPSIVSPELYSELQSTFSAEELVEMTSAFCWKNYLARFNSVYDVPENEYPG